MLRSIGFSADGFISFGEIGFYLVLVDVLEQYGLDMHINFTG
jgi:hypothetical protein